MTFTVLVCGGRTFGKIPRNYGNLPPAERAKHREQLHQHKFIHAKLDWIACELHEKLDPRRSEQEDQFGNWLPDWRIITGGATGADSVAIDWAVVNWCKWKEYPADWDKHGKSAGSIRNQLMLFDADPDLVIAFPGGPGTRDMIKKAKRAGVEVREIQYP